jgi:hypothetical protein
MMHAIVMKRVLVLCHSLTKLQFVIVDWFLSGISLLGQYQDLLT